MNCNELIAMGKRLPCNRRWAWAFFSDWIGQSVKNPNDSGDGARVQRAVDGVSTVTCAVNFKASSFCKVSLCPMMSIIYKVAERICNICTIQFHATSLSSTCS